MYKARCRRSREDARGPKKIREIHPLSPSFVFSLRFSPIGVEYPFISSRDKTYRQIISFYRAIDPAIVESTASNITRRVILINLSSTRY